MSTPASARVRPPREGRSNGQWLVDGTTPLNHNEEFKAEDNPLNVRQRIETVYAQQGFDSIPEDDLHGRFRWMGLYTQRRQDIPGSRTASLGPEELSDKYFMLRIRIDGGAVSTDQLRVIGGISREFGRDSADIIDRQ
jgi:sulfite reductase (ferredoxin)